MKKEKLIGEDLVALQQERGKACVSVVLPTHRLFSDRKVDKFEMEKALEGVSALMDVKLSAPEAKTLKNKLHDLESKIDYDHNLDGVGMYVSDDTAVLTRFPFPVTKKMMVGTDFEIRDLLYKTQVSQPYYVVMLSENHVRLFSGAVDELTEIHGGDFPLDFYDDREYSTPSRGSSTQGNPQMRSFEHDKSTIETVRIRDFYKHADELVGRYMVQDIPVIVAGVEKDLSRYEGVTAFADHIIGKISGNYEHANMADFGRKCREVFEARMKEEIDKLTDEYNDKVGRGLAVSGIQEIWTAVAEGRAHKLIVEKDFKVPGFLTVENENFLKLRPVKAEHLTMPDAVDQIIEMTLDKGGDVYFADNDRLTEYGRMLLVTRY